LTTIGEKKENDLSETYTFT
jgi:hypothetical protein